MLTDFLSHEYTPFCWCRPHVEHDEGGRGASVYHRVHALNVDHTPRARARMIEGIPA